MSLALTQNLVIKNPLIRDTVCQASYVSSKRIFTNKELVEIFPEAKKTISGLIKEDEKTLATLRELRDKVYNNLYPKVKMSSLDIATSLVMCVVGGQIIEHDIKNNKSGFIIGELVADRLERNRKLLSLYKIMSKKNKTSEDNFQIKKERAKAFPIENLVQVDRRGWSVCPFHSEKEASFKINRKLNLWYCFSCQEGGDSISLVMKLNNCSFIDAVNKLS